MFQDSIYIYHQRIMDAGVSQMATESFDMALIIDTEEKAANFLKAIDEADKRGPLKVRDFSEELRLGEELIKKGLEL